MTLLLQTYKGLQGVCMRKTETYAADNVIDDFPPSALSTERLRGAFQYHTSEYRYCIYGFQCPNSRVIRLGFLHLAIWFRLAETPSEYGMLVAFAFYCGGNSTNSKKRFK